jgi:hypothetical protein
VSSGCSPQVVAVIKDGLFHKNASVRVPYLALASKLLDEKPNLPVPSPADRGSRTCT